MKCREKLAISLVLTGLALWIVENIFFGWNATPQSLAEVICDWLVISMVLIGFIIKPASTTTIINIKHAKITNEVK